MFEIRSHDRNEPTPLFTGLHSITFHTKLKCKLAPAKNVFLHFFTEDLHF